MRGAYCCASGELDGCERLAEWSALVASGRSVGVASRVRRDDQLSARVLGAGEVLVRRAGLVEPVLPAGQIGQRAVERTCCDRGKAAGGTLVVPITTVTVMSSRANAVGSGVPGVVLSRRPPGCSASLARINGSPWRATRKARDCAKRL